MFILKIFKKTINNILKVFFLIENKFAFFGKHADIALPVIAIQNPKYISIGNKTKICKGSKLQVFLDQNSTTESKNPNIIIGDNCFISENFSILCGGCNKVLIGNNVLIASYVLITNENHGNNPETLIHYMDQPLICKDVIIGDGCWIGEKVVILPGVNIGKKCIVGAASVVTKDIPDNSIVVGNPAKIIKQYNFNTHSWEKV